MTGNGRLPYKVSASGHVAEQIKQLAGIAGSIGKRAAFLSSLQAIYQRLQDDPIQFGEFRYRWYNLELGRVDIPVVTLERLGSV